MLTNLLPGVRELRAPLSAGFLWLLTVWLAIEPSFPVSGEASGVIASLYRLSDGLSVLGESVALGFVAYLVGSLSMFAFSGLLSRLIVTSVEVPTPRLDGLSRASRDSLQQLAKDGLHRLQEILSLSGVSIEEFLQPMGEASERSSTNRRRRRRVEAARSVGRRSVPVIAASESGWDANEVRIAQAILRDLEIVGDVQLLGKEGDAFSAVDRKGAEVEFRLAVIPAILALAVTVALAQSLIVAALIVAVAGTASAGLLFDAAQQTRMANGLLLGFMEHGRMNAPSLTRLELQAADRADQSPAKVLARQAAASSRAIWALITSLMSVPTSAPIEALLEAHAAEERARAEVQRLERLVSQTRISRPLAGATELLDRLGGVLRVWSLYNHGVLTPRLRRDLGVGEETIQPDASGLVKEMTTAREEYAAFIDRLREIVTEVTNSEAARRSLSEDDRT